jgi:acetolactate synthase-1/2/3 large subunit
MGYGVPAAIGARIAEPRGKCLVLAGDGSVTYAIGELSTLAKYGLDIVVVVLNNGCLGYSKFGETLKWSGDYESVDFPPTDFAMIARGFGCQGIGVDRPADLADALGEAFAAGGPVLVDVRVDEWQTPELALRKRLGALQERLAQLGVKR